MLTGPCWHTDSSISAVVSDIWIFIGCPVDSIRLATSTVSLDGLFLHIFPGDGMSIVFDWNSMEFSSLLLNSEKDEKSGLTQKHCSGESWFQRLHRQLVHYASPYAASNGSQACAKQFLVAMEMEKSLGCLLSDARVFFKCYQPWNGT